MVKKIVLMTYPGTFNYGDLSVMQPVTSFTDIAEKYKGIPVQTSHRDNAKIVGYVTDAKVSKNGYTYGLLELDSDIEQTSVSLGYYVDTTEIRNNSSTLIGKIVPYHLALTDQPRKVHCAFDNLPTYSQFKDLIEMETNLLDLLTLFLMSAAALEDATDVSALDITEAADGNNTAVDIFLGEVSMYLQENGITPDADPQVLLSQITQMHQDSLAISSYVPGALQKRVKDSVTVPVKSATIVSTQYKNQNKTVILK